jgi:hypothetical protein
MRTFTGKITQEELAGALAYQWSKMNSGMEFPVRKVTYSHDAFQFLEDVEYQPLSAQVAKDMKKVFFEYSSIVWRPEGKFTNNDIVGFRTLSNGLTCMAFVADEDNLIYTVLYYDGTTIRAYIPSGGNYYNHKTHMSYGLGDVVLEKEFEMMEGKPFKNAEDRTPEENAEDAKDFWCDVENHIVFTNGVFKQPKGMKDIDPVWFKPVVVGAPKINHMDILSQYVESQDRGSVIRGILANPLSTTEQLESAFAELHDIESKREDNVGYFSGR